MKYFNTLALIVVVLVAFVTPSRASGTDATTQLSATMNEFVTILVNTPVAELRQTGLPDKALKLINSRFDFSEMTKRSLGAHWNALEANEQQEFIDAYTQMVLRFFGRSVRAAGDETIQYKREIRDGILASVETKVVSGSRDDFAIDYRLHDIDGQWKVYDMLIDHISIVNNYRAQFERVIAKSSVKELLQRMKQLES
ncbi:MAG TPA: ABC transporter substrate-binding protein [Candidatus Binatia bacterium]|jgi:phospholipid transport system substrate-binding protein